MPSGVYERKWYKNVHGTRQTNSGVRVNLDTPDDSHHCLPLAYANEQRASMAEALVSMFQDCGNESWNMRVGLEFIEMKFCPFCGSELKC